jgi:hypothetical protein
MVTVVPNNHKILNYIKQFFIIDTKFLVQKIHISWFFIYSGEKTSMFNL